MTSIRIFLFMACVALVFCKRQYYPKVKCHWTGCEGLALSGLTICKSYGYDFYTGAMGFTECPLLAPKVQCCKLDPLWPGCKWTSDCYFTDPKLACGTEFGNEFEYRRNISCGYFGSARYECCPDKNDMER
ncbi:hypothetical protein Bhyg_09030 [Pseudolycoriella hygida]|uniref:Uncharacterized protein n=1 Tax=Pseudolycoriella hygida TaxID=35572 RepID=A0A9Q0N7K6_9DIPT|nr:hypothetical protein Bhyg_09030 [Pseudolycoriella hygida]